MKQVQRFKTILSWLLLVVLLGSILTACKPTSEKPPGGPDDDTIQNPPSDGETDQSPADVDRPDDGELIRIESPDTYTLLRSDTSSVTIRNETAGFYKQLEARYKGVTLTTDYTNDKKPVINDAYEILVGKTNRAESETATEAVASAVDADARWYHIGVYGNKIVLLGSDDEGTVAAMRYFAKYYLTENTTVLEVPCNMTRTYETMIPEVIATPMGDAFGTTANLSNAPYFIDATGQTDMTTTIQSAIDAVSAAGGGVVYLPRGKYRVSDTLNIPSYVTLRGDYADPDRGSVSEGTVLILDAKGKFKSANVIALNASSAIEGLAFYYEGQTIEKPIEYRPTVQTSGNAWTIKDCTFLNSYYGITSGTKPKGMATLDNVKGTMLWRGYDSEQSADICVITDVHFSPKYWARAGAEYGAPAERDIRALMKSNGSIGMSLGDCDRDTYENITLDGFHTGIYNREHQRNGLDGSFYELEITDATVGVDLKGLNGNYGLLFTNCYIEGSEVALRNQTDDSAMKSPSNFPLLTLLNCEIKGKIDGGVKVLESEDADTDYTPRTNRPTFAATTLFNLSDFGADASGKSDVSVALQAALDAANAAGGGIVYVPAGLYRLENPVTVGENTVIMGVQQNPHTGHADFIGSILLVTYGRDGGEDDTAAITLQGKNSGVTGVLVYYPENGASESNTVDHSPAEYSYFIRAMADNTFVNDICLIAVSRAVHFDGVKGFIADRLLMTVYDNGIRATNCENGVITRIHTNGTYHHVGNRAKSILDSDWMVSSSRVYELIDNHLSPRMNLVKLDGCKGMQLRHVFHYGAKVFLDIDESDAVLINCESGHIGVRQSFHVGSNVDLRVVNFIRDSNVEPLTITGEDNYIALYHFDPPYSEPYNKVIE